MPKNKRFKDVSQMVRETESQEFSEAFEKRLADRQLIKQLILFRASQGLSQEDVAQKLGCTQSKVSKLEASNDGDLQMDDLARYAMAIGLQPQVVFFRKGAPAAEIIKYHFFETKELLQKLAALASTNGDTRIAKGLAVFYAEVWVNFLNMLAESTSALPDEVQCEIPFVKFVDDSPGNGECEGGSDKPAIIPHSPKRIATA